MNPKTAKELNDKIEALAKSSLLKGMDLLDICDHRAVTQLSQIYAKDNLMIARMIVQIQKHGTYRESKFKNYYR